MGGTRLLVVNGTARAELLERRVSEARARALGIPDWAVAYHVRLDAGPVLWLSGRKLIGPGAWEERVTPVAPHPDDLYEALLASPEAVCQPLLAAGPERIISALAPHASIRYPPACAECVLREVETPEGRLSARLSVGAERVHAWLRRAAEPRALGLALLEALCGPDMRAPVTVRPKRKAIFSPYRMQGRMRRLETSAAEMAEVILHALILEAVERGSLAALREAIEPLVLRYEPRPPQEHEKQIEARDGPDLIDALLHFRASRIYVTAAPPALNAHPEAREGGYLQLLRSILSLLGDADPMEVDPFPGGSIFTGSPQTRWRAEG